MSFFSLLPIFFSDVDEDEDAAHELKMAQIAAAAAKNKKKKEVVAKSNM